MAWFPFRQNNSGGVFEIDHEAGIGPNVWIEADNAETANQYAIAVGIYFDGVDIGNDCECCGDRWDEACEEDGFEEPEVDTDWDFMNHDCIYFHFADGSIAALQAAPDKLN